MELYKKHRPRNFSRIVGQPTIIEQLTSMTQKINFPMQVFSVVQADVEKPHLPEL